MLPQPFYGLLFSVVITSQAFAETAEVSALLAENPDPFADLDMVEVLAAYGPDGSGVALVLGGIALALSASDLVSDVSDIGGATGIVSDPSGFGFTIGLSGDYLFAFDEFALTDDARDALSKVLALYEEYEGTDIVIEGHTDAKGSEAYNQTLSEQRADVVYQWFVENGVDNNLITAQGFGETQPIAENEIGGQDNPEGRALNRRVDIRITTAKRVNSVLLDRN